MEDESKTPTPVFTAPMLDKETYIRLRVVQFLFESGSASDRNSVLVAAEKMTHYILTGEIESA